MPTAIDLTGHTYGEWTVLRRAFRNRHGNWYWWARCASCKVVQPVLGLNMRSGISTRCKPCGHAVRKARNQQARDKNPY